MTDPRDPVVEIVDNPDADRYELRHDGEVAGWVDYRLHDGVMTIPHVEVAGRLRGGGHSGPFLTEVLADVERRGLRIIPLCGYAAAHVRARPELHHLLA
ncbi:MAG: GNAT family N-acetyltransferase [Acidimicrobiales bacterium]